MAEIQTVRLTAADGPPTVDVLIGQAQFGRYELALFDLHGRNPIVVGAGLSHDQVPDTFSIAGDPRQLNGRFLSWSANLVPAGNETNPRFSFRVHIRQRGIEVSGSPIHTQGDLSAPRAEFGFVKLEVV